MDVSIVIVNWNTREILHKCLDSVYQQTRNIDFEVIVIDNGSTDGSAEMVQAEFCKVRLIRNLNNAGFAAGCNQGIAVSKGRYVLLLNSDTVILDNAIAKTVGFADSHPKAAVVSCRVLNPDGTMQQTCFMFPSILNLFLACTHLCRFFPSSRFFGREYMTWWKRDDVREVDVVTGCFMLLRQKALKQTGVLDERFFMYGEETDLCYRLKQAGWVTLFTTDAEIIHLDCASTNKMAEKMLLQLRGSVCMFIKKHKSFPEYVLACMLTSVFFALRAPYWFLKGLLINDSRKNSFLMAKTYLTQ